MGEGRASSESFLGVELSMWVNELTRYLPTEDSPLYSGRCCIVVAMVEGNWTSYPCWLVCKTEQGVSRFWAENIGL